MHNSVRLFLFVTKDGEDANIVVEVNGFLIRYSARITMMLRELES